MYLIIGLCLYSDGSVRTKFRGQWRMPSPCSEESDHTQRSSSYQHTTLTWLPPRALDEERRTCGDGEILRRCIITVIQHWLECRFTHIKHTLPNCQSLSLLAGRLVD